MMRLLVMCLSVMLVAGVLGCGSNDDTAESRAEKVSGLKGDITTETVADDDWILSQFGIVDDSHNFPCEQISTVLLPPATIAVSG